MKSHTGGVMTLGKGAIYESSMRQRINTKSSTESELVAVNDVMPQILWTRYFLESQGYKVHDSVLYQDNQSAMLLERNGRGSSSKRTRHINIRYFFIKDRIASGEVKLEYCPTETMLADAFTKPLQGSAFIQFRDSIMNGSSHKSNDIQTRSVLRIPHDKVREPHAECTNKAEKVSPSGKNKLKSGVSWAQVVVNRVPAIPTIATGVKVSSSACVSAKTKNLTLM